MSVNSLTLENHEHTRLAQWLNEDAWIVACLCAAWCDTCRAYRDNFDRLAAMHPNKRFVWIDIEDQADVVGEIDVENFPTLLMQRGDIVAFFGTVLPDIKLAHRLIIAHTEKSDEELRREAASSTERIEWQNVCDLRVRLKEASSF